MAPMSSRRAAKAQPWDNADDFALAYALAQLTWYDRAHNRARHAHQIGELVILLSASSTVVVSALHAPAWATATLAAVTLFLTGYRQVFNPNERWVTTSTAWLQLQQAVARYHLLPPEERDLAARRALFDRTIEVMSMENHAWAEQRRGGQPMSMPEAAQKPVAHEG
jgi:hypothetical protein